MALSRMAGTCASAMATSAQTMTRTNSAIAPMNLRRRSGIEASDIRSVASAGRSTIWSARAATSEPMTEATTTQIRPTRAPIRLWLYAVAALVLAMVLVGGATRLTESGLSITEWKPVMGVLPPLGERAVAGRVRKISGHSAIPRTQRRHEPCRVQDDLLVGMDASAARPADRRGVPVAVPVVSLARIGGAGAAPAAVVHFRARRAARRSRLVDGRVRPRRSRRGLAIPAGDASHPRLRDLCRADLDGAAARRATVGSRACAHSLRAPCALVSFSCWRKSISARWSPDCAPVMSTTPGR